MNEGSIPAELSQLSCLTSLSINFNKLTGNLYILLYVIQLHHFDRGNPSRVMSAKRLREAMAN